MGHASSIALGVALNKPHKKYGVLMEMQGSFNAYGAMAVIGNINPKNLIHIVINNGAHVRDCWRNANSGIGCIDLTEIAKSLWIYMCEINYIH